jgi:hypothetical protein
MSTCNTIVNATTNPPRTELTANQVAEACGNNEGRIFKVARYAVGYWQKESWFIAAQKIADELNAGCYPAEALLGYLENI